MSSRPGQLRSVGQREGAAAQMAGSVSADFPESRWFHNTTPVHGRAGAGGGGRGGRGGLLQLEAVLSVYVHMQTFMRKHVQVCLYTGVRKGMHVLRIFDTHIHAYMRICVHKHFFLYNTYKRRPR